MVATLDSGPPPTRADAGEVGSPLPREGVLGIPAELTHPVLQTDAFKELINKLAWVLGTTYRVPYGNVRTAARSYAMALAKHCVKSHGYPAHIGKEPS